MTKLRNILAVALCAVMVFSCGTVAIAQSTDEEVIAKVSALGIMVGNEQGDFMAQKGLTRAEAAAIFVRMKGINESAVKSAEGATQFKDVALNHWATGYINVASNYGIINGVGDSMFAPERMVTIQEVETMAIRTIGAGALVDAQGMWPVNYVNFANEEKISDGVYALASGEASRINTARIVLNTLEVPIWEKGKVTTNKEVTWEKGAKTILTDTLKITKDTKTASSFSNKDKKFEGLDCKVDLSNVREGIKYDIYVNDNKEVIYLAESENQDSIRFTSIKKVNVNENKVTLVVDGKEKEYTFDNTITITANEMTFGVAYLEKEKIIKFFPETYNTFKIIKEVTDKKITFKEGGQLSINYDNNEYYFAKDGKAIKLSDLKVGDAIAYYSQNNKYVGEVLTNSVRGIVDSVATDYIRIDNVKYNRYGNETYTTEEDVVIYLFNDKIVLKDVIDHDINLDAAVVIKVKDYTDKYNAPKKEITLQDFAGKEIVKTLKDGTIHIPAVGDVIRYKEDTKDKEIIEIVDRGNKEENIVTGNYNFKYRNNSYIMNYYDIDEYSIIYLVKTISNNEIELLKLKISQLDTQTLNATLYVVDDYVEAAVVRGNVQYTLSEDYAFVAAKEQRADDFAYVLETINGEKVCYSKNDYNLVNSIVKYSIDGEELLAIEKVNSINGNGTSLTYSDEKLKDENTKYFISDALIVLDENGKCEVINISELEEEKTYNVKLYCNSDSEVLAVKVNKIN